MSVGVPYNDVGLRKLPVVAVVLQARHAFGCACALLLIVPVHGVPGVSGDRRPAEGTGCTQGPRHFRAPQQARLALGQPQALHIRQGAVEPREVDVALVRLCCLW